MSYRQIKTMKGYDLFEVVSAFQKEIRRGNEDNAMWWGVELHESGFVPYAWKRMMVIAIEDIGLASPNAPLMIKTLKEVYDEMKKANDKKHQYRLPFVQAILYLVNSPKSRHTDWALNYWFDSHKFAEYDKEVPDYAIDIHTRRGKQMGRTIEHFFTEGSKLNNHHVQESEEFYMNECRKRWNDKVWCERATAESKRREEFAAARYKNKQTDTQPNTNGEENSGVLPF